MEIRHFFNSVFKRSMKVLIFTPFQLLQSITTGKLKLLDSSGCVEKECNKKKMMIWYDTVNISHGRLIKWNWKQHSWRYWYIYGKLLLLTYTGNVSYNHTYTYTHYASTERWEISKSASFTDGHTRIIFIMAIFLNRVTAQQQGPRENKKQRR